MFKYQEFRIIQGNHHFRKSENAQYKSKCNDKLPASVRSTAGTGLVYVHNQASFILASKIEMISRSRLFAARAPQRLRVKMRSDLRYTSQIKSPNVQGTSTKCLLKDHSSLMYPPRDNFNQLHESNANASIPPRLRPQFTSRNHRPKQRKRN